jgi:CubicO group peptidase (beta-lactamase class C family)
MRSKSSSILPLFLFSLIFVHANAQIKNSFNKSIKGKDYSAVINSINSTVKKKMAEHNILGVSVALVDDQSVVWVKGFGYTDQSRTTQVNEETLFSTRSISKTYTATAFLMEVEKGKYNIDDKITTYYPSFAVHSRYGDNQGKEITFRHLLSHRAGFCHEAPLGSNYDTVHCTFEEHIKSIGDAWLRLPIGKFYSYSNIGPDITGYILSRDAGMPVEEYLKQHVLEPLGMKRSTYDQEEAYASGNLAKGYVGNKELEKTYIADLAAGGLYSNTGEMAKFLFFQFNDCKMNGKTVISPELLTQMHTVQFKLDGQVAGYGLGVMLRPFHGATLVYHIGGGYGYRALQAWIPALKLGVIVLTNNDDAYSSVNEIGDEALEGMIKAKYGSLPETNEPAINQLVVSLSGAYLNHLTGTYKGDGNMLEMVRVNNKLAVVSGTDTNLLTARSDTEFVAGYGDRFVFSYHGSGNPAYFISVNKYNADFYIFNDSPNEKPGANKPSWRALTGLYKGFNNRQEQIITLFMKNGYLYCSAGGPTKVTEYRPGIYFTTDGESLIKKGKVLYLGNKAYVSSF